MDDYLTPKDYYDKLLSSGEFWNRYPQLTGSYIEDEEEWEKIYNNYIHRLPKRD